MLPKLPSVLRGKLSRALSFVLGGLAAVSPLSHSSVQDPSEPVFTLSPFEVAGSEGTNDWTINQSSGGTRVAVAVKGLPFSLDVLTTEYMEDFVLSDVAETLPHVGNVSSLESHTGAGSGNAIRGFRSTISYATAFTAMALLGEPWWFV